MDYIIPVKDKISRARSWQAKTRAHHVYYDKDASWWPDLFEEMSRFPKAAHDDQIDPQSQLGLALDTLRQASTPLELEEEEYNHMLRQDAHQGRSETTGY